MARLRPPGSPCSLGPALAGGAAAAGSPARAGALGLEAGPCEGAAPNLERRSASLERLSRSLSQARSALLAGRRGRAGPAAHAAKGDLRGRGPSAAPRAAQHAHCAAAHEHAALPSAAVFAVCAGCEELLRRRQTYQARAAPCAPCPARHAPRPRAGARRGRRAGHAGAQRGRPGGADAAPAQRPPGALLLSFTGVRDRVGLR